jgi:hypothetical protein
MYRHSHLTLGSGALGGFALHLTGTGAAWTIVLSATAIGVAVSVARIAIDLGAPHPARILRAFRLRHVLAAADLCPHCGTAHA